ncbi:hypothetical protein THAOC_33429 [Thalassiosira oceanica]|uniref:Uncharacterized protein n=1 Tax=Thalassiosira oceanica TaxID=159749 RepID=K0RM70_THAOC|nr:hypothetical protein THAOC_33429 [Thalassiosira oceanica]|eukprot:EJK47822.1 hypothetical protein THAOC_33429 [Thalassiosira oceanica]
MSVLLDARTRRKMRGQLSMRPTRCPSPSSLTINTGPPRSEEKKNKRTAQVAYLLGVQVRVRRQSMLALLDEEDRKRAAQYASHLVFKSEFTDENRRS